MAGKKSPLLNNIDNAVSNNDDIGIIANVKNVINVFCQSSHIEGYRDVNLLTFGFDFTVF